MDKDRPRTNIAVVLAENFKEEQKRFLDAQLKFKSGFVFYGLIAAGLLTSMYYILPAARHASKDEVASKKFVDDLDLFRGDIYTFVKRKGDDEVMEKPYPLTPEYRILDDKFDAQVRQFYKIMYETGFSP